MIFFPVSKELRTVSSWCKASHCKSEELVQMAQRYSEFPVLRGEKGLRNFLSCFETSSLLNHRICAGWATLARLRDSERWEPILLAACSNALLITLFTIRTATSRLTLPSVGSQLQVHAMTFSAVGKSPHYRLFSPRESECLF